MARDSSFDVVSTVDMQEVDNAYQQATREIAQRYDLKGTGASLALAKGEGVFTVEAPSEFVAGQVRDILGSKPLSAALTSLLCAGTRCRLPRA